MRVVSVDTLTCLTIVGECVETGDASIREVSRLC